MDGISIEKKIFKITLISVIISLASLGVIAVGSIAYLRSNTIAVYSQLADTVSDDSMRALADVAGNGAEKLIRKRAELADEKLNMWRSATIVLARSAENIAKNRQNYAPQPLDDDFAWVWYSKDADKDSLRHEVELFGNIQNSLRGVNFLNPNTSVAYLGSESGFFITGSKPPSQGETVDATERPWYVAAKQANGVAWTDIYEDALGFGYTVTCSAPFYDNDDNLVGVVGVDVFLNDLSWIVSDGRSWNSERSFIIDENGNAIVSGAVQDGMHWNNLMDLLSAEEGYADILDDITKGETGFDITHLSNPLANDNQQWLIAYTALNTRPWRIVTMIDLAEIYSPAVIMQNNIENFANQSEKHIGNVILTVISIFIILLVATALITGIISKRFAHTLTIPINALKESVSTISQGDFCHRVTVSTDDEIGELGDSVNKMAHDLETYIESLQDITREKERIETELSVAAKIQASMLPCVYPAFPECSQFDIYASMLPAKEVGGDFYDFFLVDKNTLAVVAADVSGKGVPAALFMVVAKTLIQNTSLSGKSPEVVFGIVNRMLCANNDAGMFVTAILGYLDLPTGKFTFVNAGHNPPLIRSGAQFEWLKVRAGFVLAGDEDTSYTQSEITLNPGDELFFYTDGVTEAVNCENQLFGDPRLLECANKHIGIPLKEFTLAIKENLDDFANGAEQADDITMLSLRFGARK